MKVHIEVTVVPDTRTATVSKTMTLPFSAERSPMSNLLTIVRTNVPEMVRSALAEARAQDKREREKVASR